MDFATRINDFLKLDHKAQLDSWMELKSIGSDFLTAKINDRELAKIIADSIMYHRELMGSSKAYESAFDIDTDLLFIAIPIARIAYGKNKALIGFLKAGLYYSDVLPDRFGKVELENEIKQISENIR